MNRWMRGLDVEVELWCESFSFSKNFIIHFLGEKKGGNGEKPK